MGSRTVSTTPTRLSTAPATLAFISRSNCHEAESEPAWIARTSQAVFRFERVACPGAPNRSRTRRDSGTNLAKRPEATKGRNAGGRRLAAGGGAGTGLEDDRSHRSYSQRQRLAAYWKSEPQGFRLAR